MGQTFVACTKKENSKSWSGMIAYQYDNGAKLSEHYFIGNKFVEAVMDRLFGNPMQVVWAGQYAKPRDNHRKNLFNLARPLKKHNTRYATSSMRYIINHTKGLYIDLYEMKPDKEGRIINPLPILTAEGNGSGLGDYHGTFMNLVGIWSGDVISVDILNLIEITHYKKFNVNFKYL